jgi:hypothetical protein
MPNLNAVGWFVVAVCAFDLTAALIYSLSGYVDWPLAAVFITGGVGGFPKDCRRRHSNSRRNDIVDPIKVPGADFQVRSPMFPRSTRTVHIN